MFNFNSMKSDIVTASGTECLTHKIIVPPARPLGRRGMSCALGFCHLVLSPSLLPSGGGGRLLQARLVAILTSRVLSYTYCPGSTVGMRLVLQSVTKRGSQSHCQSVASSTWQQEADIPTAVFGSVAASSGTRVGEKGDKCMHGQLCSYKAALLLQSSIVPRRCRLVSRGPGAVRGDLRVPGLQMRSEVAGRAFFSHMMKRNSKKKVMLVTWYPKDRMLHSIRRTRFGKLLGQGIFAEGCSKS